MDDDFFTIQWEKPTNIDDAVKMIRKLKQIFPIAGIIWQPEDVIQYGKDHNPKIDVPKDIANDVINLMESNKDCNYGITWDLLANILDGQMEMAFDDEPGLCPWCNGSGEGQHDGTICTHCKGTGEVKNG